jgi:hypothetical protein
MFDDSPQPFMPGDDLPKPKVGDKIILREPDDTFGLREGIVEVTWDSLAEDWGSDGESAWSMWDYNEETGFRGHWYASIVVASYEVATTVSE